MENEMVFPDISTVKSFVLCTHARRRLRWQSKRNCAARMRHSAEFKFRLMNNLSAQLFLIFLFILAHTSSDARVEALENKRNIEMVKVYEATCRRNISRRSQQWKMKRGEKLKRKLLSRINIVCRKLKRSSDGIIPLKISVSRGIKMCVEAQLRRV